VLTYPSTPSDSPKPKPAPPPQPVYTPTGPPDAPRNVQALEDTYMSLRIMWTPSERATGYVLWRDNVKIVDITTPPGWSSGPPSSYVDEGLDPDTKYIYTVQAYNAFDASAHSLAAGGRTFPKY
jgi:hypothetical protein